MRIAVSHYKENNMPLHSAIGEILVIIALLNLDGIIRISSYYSVTGVSVRPMPYRLWDQNGGGSFFK